MAVAESHKELRFTRARQAMAFSVAGGMLVMLALGFFLVSRHPFDDPPLPHPAWGLLPLLLAFLCLRIAWHCARHAYLLLSPIGVEIFPFFRPAEGMQVVPWAQIAAAEIDSSRLTLHFTAEKTAGIHLSLSPISVPQRVLLAAAILGRFPRLPPSPTPDPHAPRLPPDPLRGRNLRPQRLAL